MRRIVRRLLLLSVFAAPAAARADEVPMTEIIGEQAEIFGDQLLLKLDMFHLLPEQADKAAAAPLEYALDYQLDYHQKRARARVRLGGGDERVLALRLDARVRLDVGMPRVQGTIELGLAGHRLRLTLPEVIVVPRSYEGETYLEYRVPLLEGRF